MRILVTGGAGFIGSHFVKLLLNNSELREQVSHLTVIDNLTYAADLRRLSDVENDSKYTFVKGSILDPELVTELIDDSELIFNFAAETHVDNSIKSPNDFILTNVLGVQTLINSLVGKPAKRLIQVSTDEVYGEILSGSTTESHPLNPSSPYSASKAAGELLILAAARTYGLDYIITRGSNTYGSGQYPEKIIPKFIRCALNGEAVPVYGDGLQSREWLHASDHAKAIWLAGTHKGLDRIFNIGSGIEMTNLELISQINQIRTDFQLIPRFVEDRLGHDRRYSLDSTKMRNVLGFTPQVNFNEGLLTTLNEELSLR